MSANQGPLAGIRVLDLSTVVMGPWATHILAGYGADVIKVEPPAGDVMRHAGASRHAGMGSLFLFMNRGKRSIALDLKLPAARAALLRLCESADVLIHNIRPAAMARLGLGYDDVAAVNPRLVYASLVGFDQRGPYAARPAYDDLVQGVSGMAGLYRRVYGGEPRYAPELLADRVTGMNAAHAVLAALLQRERGGAGQALEIPMFETMAELVLSDHLGGSLFDPPAGPVGYERILTPNRQPLRTSDGYVCMLLYTEPQWARFFDLVGERARFEADPRLSDPAARRRDYDYAYGAVAEIVARRPTAEWLAVLAAADIPAGPLSEVEDLVADPQLAVSAWDVVEHPSEGRVRVPRRPVQGSALGDDARGPAPRLNEHGADILRAAGYDEDAIAAILPS
jgi:crotonobetainyl-CoA:carnitine CoA-transferase CaiB-like acyl-CoA transferase